MYATETTQSAAVAAAATSGSKTGAADGELFSQELWARIKTSTPSEEKIARTMEKLANAFPGTSVTKMPLSAFGEIGNYFIQTGAGSAANVAPEVMSAMADDEGLFNRVKGMIESLMSAGREQELAPSISGGSTTRSVNISAGEARYIEVQRGPNGQASSLMSIVFDIRQQVNEALDALIGQRGNGSAGGSFSGSETWFGRSSSSGGASSGFSGILDYSGSWRMESMFTADSSAMRMVQARQSQVARIEVLIQQMEGRSVSGTSFFELMEMSGLTDPLVLDLGGEGINLTSREDGVYFDIKGDGTPVKTSWISGNNAFLYMDSNGNGTADDVNELFGDQGGYANGFEKLAQYDDNGDGVLDEKDAAYRDLRLWRDVNGDGVNQAHESMTLAEAGIASLNVRYAKNWEYDQHGNAIGETSSFTRSDGSTGTMADVWLKHG